MRLMQSIREKLCRHAWETRQVLIYNPEIKLKKQSSIKQKWLMETIDYMKSIDLDGLLPYFFRECKKCGKQTTPGIDTLVKATIIDWYIPEYEWMDEDFTHIENKYPMEIFHETKT